LGSNLLPYFVNFRWLVSNLLDVLVNKKLTFQILCVRLDWRNSRACKATRGQASNIEEHKDRNEPILSNF